MTKIAVKQVPEAEVPTEILAESIVSIAEGVRKLRAGRLNDRALFMLVANAAPNIGKFGSKPVSMKEVKAVFDGIESLEAMYLKKKPLPSRR